MCDVNGSRWTSRNCQQKPLHQTFHKTTKTNMSACTNLTFGHFDLYSRALFVNSRSNSAMGHRCQFGCFSESSWRISDWSSFIRDLKNQIKNKHRPIGRCAYACWRAHRKGQFWVLIHGPTLQIKTVLHSRKVLSTSLTP